MNLTFPKKRDYSDKAWVQSLHRKISRSYESNPTINSVDKLVEQLVQWLPITNSRAGADIAANCVVVDAFLTSWADKQCREGSEFAAVLMDRMAWKFAVILLETVTDHSTTIIAMRKQLLTAGITTQAHTVFAGKIVLRYKQLYDMSIACKELVPHPQTWGFTQAEQDHIAKEGAFLGQALDERREYGVKACFLRDGFFHARNEAWAFQDGYQEHRANLTHEHLSPNPIATVMCSAKDTIFRMAKKRKNLWPPTEEYPARMAFAIQRDGSLSCASNQAVPLEKIFQLTGHEDAYAMFHFVQMLRIYSLIVPETVRREYGVPQLPELPKAPKARDAYMADLPGVFRRMWLPRTRLETPAPTNATNAEPQTRNNPQEVVGFFRKLPKGHTASEQAKALALREKGKLPPPGKTYVKERIGDELSLREVRR